MSEVGVAKTIEIDIATRVVRPSEQVFVLFPGEGHMFYDVMSTRSAVFLDLPGFDLSGAKRIEDVGKLKQRIALSASLSEWHLSDGRKKEPSRNLDDYQSSRLSERRELLMGAIDRLYFRMKPGDIIIVPGPGYLSDVMIGEIVGERPASLRERRYGSDAIPARRVKWLARRPKRKFSDELIKRFGLPNFLVQLDRSFLDEVFRATFASYVYDDLVVARFDTVEHSFTTLDEFNIQSFFNFVAGVMAANETGEFGTGEVNFQDALNALEGDLDLVPSLTANINSPGALTVYSDRLVPLVVAALMAVALSGEASAKPRSVTVVNSLAPLQDRCAVKVDASVKEALTLMNFDAWQEACYRAQRAAKGTGISSPAKLTTATTPRKAS